MVKNNKLTVDGNKKWKVGDKVFSNLPEGKKESLKEIRRRAGLLVDYVIKQEEIKKMENSDEPKRYTLEDVKKELDYPNCPINWESRHIWEYLAESGYHKA